MELQRSSITSESAKIGFVGDKQSVYGHLVAALYEAKQYDKAFEYVERAKARALVDILAAKEDFAVKGGNKEQIRAALAMNESAEREAGIQDVSIDREKTRSIQIRTRDELRSKAPELASLVTVAYQSSSDIQSLIPKEEALIEYYYFDKYLYAFVISGGKLQAFRTGRVAASPGISGSSGGGGGGRGGRLLTEHALEVAQELGQALAGRRVVAGLIEAADASLTVDQHSVVGHGLVSALRLLVVPVA